MVPFCTSHSSGIGSSAVDLHALCPDSVEWVEGMRFEAGTARDAMEEWIQSIGIG
nr:flavodoxin [uncultured Acetatifactor sp.]